MIKNKWKTTEIMDLMLKRRAVKNRKSSKCQALSKRIKERCVEAKKWINEQCAELEELEKKDIQKMYSQIKRNDQEVIEVSQHSIKG